MPDLPVYEDDFQTTVIETAEAFGWEHIYHTHDSRRSRGDRLRGWIGA